MRKLSNLAYILYKNTYDQRKIFIIFSEAITRKYFQKSYYSVKIYAFPRMKMLDDKANLAADMTIIIFQIKAKLDHYKKTDHSLK